MFGHYSSSDMYLNAHVKGVEPMTAKELNEEQQEEALESDSNFIEEKFDGTRATLHFYKVDPYISKLFERKSIEDKALIYSLLRGTPYVDGMKRVYDFFTQNDYNSANMSEFLRKEYGTGGYSSPDKVEGTEIAYSYASDGLRVMIGGFSSPRVKDFRWDKVARVVEDLIEDGVYYPQKAYTRCFSRRVSKKTNWYCENTDSLPHLRDLCVPELAGTIIDGEMFIPNRPFKDVSSTLNCTYDKAVERQEELGKIVFHAFDILYYKGVCVEKLPLYKRKELLKEVVKTADSPYIELVNYQSCGDYISTVTYEDTHGNLTEVFNNLGESKNAYPTFYNEMRESKGNTHLLSPKAFYEYIVATGGEGVIVKSKEGKYLHKRGWEYSKIKKYLTRDLIVIGFSEPTKEYTGKFPNNHWDYWIDKNTGFKLSADLLKNRKADELKECSIPVTRHWYENQVGQLKLGVILTFEELAKIPDNKRGELFTVQQCNITNKKYAKGYTVMQVCECGGFDDEQRKDFTDNTDKYVGSVVEVKANEIFKDTGKLRHPRFLRVRFDKEPERCTWEDHIL